MDEVRTIDEYVAAVREALADLPERQRTDAVAELDQLLREQASRHGERAAIEAVGLPDAYANDIRAAIVGEPADGPVPQGRILGMPYEFREVTAERVAERIWNPADPRIFMPRLFGIGWTINFGALAVRLGLLRPDDAGDEVFDRIPGSVIRAALSVPVGFAAATLALAAIAWPSLPPDVPIHWGVSGAPDDWASKPFAFGLLLALTVLPVAVTYARVLRRGTSARTRILSAAALGLVSSLGFGIAVFTVADADGGRSGNWMWLVILGSLVLSFLLLYVPTRLGIRAEWRDATDHPSERD